MRAIEFVFLLSLACFLTLIVYFIGQMQPF